MGLIDRIEILVSKCNLDYRTPTSLWPVENQIGVAQQHLDSLKSFSLQEGLLPQGHVLQTPGKLYAVVGGNGVGKTTFLKAIARSVENARLFSLRNRTVMFRGKFGMDDDQVFLHFRNLEKDQPYNTNLFPKIVNGTHGIYDPNLFEQFQDCLEGPLAVRELGEREPETYFYEALGFYLGRDEIFTGPDWNTLERLSDEQIATRLSYHTHRSMYDKGDEQYEIDREAPVQPEVMDWISQVSGELDVALPLVERRLCYIAEHADSIAQRDLPVNVYGELGLSMDAHFLSLSVGIFDVNLQNTNELSKGQYTKERLQGLSEHEGPILLLLDEPTGNTDMLNTMWVYNEFLPNVVRRENIQMFAATNDTGLVRKIHELGGECVNMYKTPVVVERLDV